MYYEKYIKCRETYLTWGIFILLYSLLVARAFLVFYTHDEIVTKWAYMVEWNPLPYMGYIDANNHFLNSFLGGLFIRIFQTDAIWVVRFPNLLAFPLYFWSIVGLRPFFQRPIHFWVLLITLTFSGFLTDYFHMARGYGISMALLMWGILEAMRFFSTHSKKHLLLSICGWTLAVYANLTLIPFALIMLASFTFLLVKNHAYKWLLLILVGIIPIGYAITYSFHLKHIQKLYLGSQDGFFEGTIHSLTPYLWNTEHWVLDLVLTAVTLVITIWLIRELTKRKSLFNSHTIFASLFLLAIANILAQNWILGINFPEDRAAIYLVIFFFGALAFFFDALNLTWGSYLIIFLTLFLFTRNLNLSHFTFFYYEHFDQALLTKVPSTVNGTPPSTGGRFWRMDNELLKENNIPYQALQLANTPSDTLTDFVVTTKEHRPDITTLYHPIYTDPISSLTLYQRNTFLHRKFLADTLVTFNGQNEFTGLYEIMPTHPLLYQLTGQFEHTTPYEEAIIVFSGKDTNNQHVFYEALPISECCVISEDGTFSFDFSFVVNTLPSVPVFKVYIWNRNKIVQQGKMKVQVYQLGDL